MFAGLKQQFQRAGSNTPLRFLLGEARPAQRAGKPGKVAPPERGLRRFLRETRSELKKVTWPTREQATRLTGIVIAVSVAVGLVLGSIDFIFQEFFQLLLGAR